jgi:exodeoxyribonuclease V alpha subunit
MRPVTASPPQEALAGIVERVTFHNAENGFCVLRTKARGARGHRDLVTVVGHSATIAAGEWITATGQWVNDRTHGQRPMPLDASSHSSPWRVLCRRDLHPLEWQLASLH